MWANSISEKKPNPLDPRHSGDRGGSASAVAVGFELSRPPFTFARRRRDPHLSGHLRSPDPRSMTVYIGEVWSKSGHGLSEVAAAPAGRSVGRSVEIARKAGYDRRGRSRSRMMAREPEADLVRGVERQVRPPLERSKWPTVEVCPPLPVTQFELARADDPLWLRTQPRGGSCVAVLRRCGVRLRSEVPLTSRRTWRSHGTYVEYEPCA